MRKLKNYFLPGCLVMPMILHWLLPSGIETKLYIQLFGITLFIPDFLYIIYLILYNSNSNRNHPYLDSNRKKILAGFVFVIIVPITLILILKGVTYTFDLLTNNLSFIWLAVLFLCFPLSKKQIEFTRPFLSIALGILIIEVLIFSLGIMTYTTATGSSLKGQDYDGIMRISTTIGAATGTAVVIGLLGAVVLCTYRWSSRAKILWMITISLGVYFTMSRGTSLVWTIFIAYYFYINYLKKNRRSQKIKYLFGFLIIVSIFYLSGGMNPILNRVEHMQHSGDASAGRNSKWDKSMRMIADSAPWGYGLGQVMPEKAIEMQYTTPHHFAPHNVYTLVSIELGYFGIVIFILFIIFLMSGTYYKSSLAIYLWFVWLINSNTESFVLESESMALIMFAIMTITRFSHSQNQIHI
ncbi:MAG: O-antigen ligase family protein [Muribaculum sp.]|nr:O-antigen ligase family protein [Muribaculum sp.]